MLRVIAPAKVNLHLSVGSLRPDGYHDLTSVFHALELADELVIAPSDLLRVVCDTDLGIDPVDNLVYRAADAMSAAFETPASFQIALHKHIPHGAGMGGGSSDAAAVILGLATLWGVDPRDQRCLKVARDLGADVAFFLCETGAALMTGRGDTVGAELPPLAGMPVVVLCPPSRVSTPMAYRRFDADPVPGRSADVMVEALKEGDRAMVVRSLFNNLAPAAVSLAPQIADALDWLVAGDGVLGAAVSGSGSAVYALCADEAAAEMLAGRALVDTPWWAVRTALGPQGVHVKTNREVTT